MDDCNDDKNDIATSSVRGEKSRKEKCFNIFAKEVKIFFLGRFSLVTRTEWAEKENISSATVKTQSFSSPFNL